MFVDLDLSHVTPFYLIIRSYLSHRARWHKYTLVIYMIEEKCTFSLIHRVGCKLVLYVKFEDYRSKRTIFLKNSYSEKIIIEMYFLEKNSQNPEK